MAFNFILILCLAVAGTATRIFALEPQQILIIANSDVNESLRLAEYYCAKRAVPAENILKIPLGQNLAEDINRPRYDNILAAAVRDEIQGNRLPGEITCLLTLYGVPIKVGHTAPLKNLARLVPKLERMLDAEKRDFNDLSDKLNHLGRQEMIDHNESRPRSYENALNRLPGDIKRAVRRIEYVEPRDAAREQYDKLAVILKKIYGPVYARENYPRIVTEISRPEEAELNKAGLILQLSGQGGWSIEKKLDMNFYKAAEFAAGLVGVISNLKDDIGRCKGAETSASVDSELSMVLYKNYDLYRWQKNELLDSPSFLPAKTLMVSRLDGPSAQIAEGLVDKALEAEKNGLSGRAYIDTRGLNITRKPAPYSFEFFDEKLYLLADELRNRTSMEVVIEKTPSLFVPGSCPKTAIYCGWYSLKKYVDAFDFVPGAVGFHIASMEAADLRNPAASNWCPAMLSRGITATLGPVNEPYLLAFPLPDKFFAELLNGKCLVEAYYRTNPFNSWQFVLIGDPLYRLNIK